ncbi:MAG: hypothetical protein E6I06_14160 [Chloroflexi bacterium]|nr:MAG: hypothetical protein E6I06_14160 [Chloroflexota bacterium]
MVAFVVASNHLSIVGVAAAPAVNLAAVRGQGTETECAAAAATPTQCGVVSTNGMQLSLPEGSQACPRSGAAVACSANQFSSPQPGASSTPDGQTACSVPDGIVAPSSVAACTDAGLPAVVEGAGSDNLGAPSVPTVLPSVPMQSLRPSAAVLPPARLELTTTSPAPVPDQSIVLVATASVSVTGTNRAIEIFDETTSTLAGACLAGSQCSVAYSAKSGIHTFAAFITPPTSQLPANGSAIASNRLNAKWLAVSLAVSTIAVGPGKPVTLTATSTVPVEKLGYDLQIFDLNTNAKLTYCRQGTSCSSALAQPTSGARALIAVLGKPSQTFPPPEAQAQSRLVSPVWLSVGLEGHWNGQAGSIVYLTATVNADLSSTPWSLGIFDEQGHLVAPPCKSGSTCGAEVVASGAKPHFTAAIGAVPPTNTGNPFAQLMQKLSGPASLINIQTRSASIEPTHMMWGVDSCKAFTTDPNGGNGLYPQIVQNMGTPDFWGRYLTDTVCPGISWTEVFVAKARHMGILPIYNDYNCSSVVGYDVGRAYADEAISAATFLRIPQGVGLAIDIEPPGDACPGAVNVDPGFVEGWFDGVKAAHYAPIYYGNGTAGSEFANAFCGAVAANPQIARDSFLWSFQPSLLGNFAKASAPGFGPYNPGCGGNLVGWQYQIGSYSVNPDVDHDLMLSVMPLWYPS